MFGSSQRKNKVDPTPGSDVVLPLNERVTRAREALSVAETGYQAMIALSEADLPTLRAIELTYFHQPGPAANLRVRIADAHEQFRAAWKTQMLNTDKVTAAHVTSWAAETLRECLPGLTEFREDWGGQYQIAHVVDEGDPCDAAVYEVRTAQGFGLSRFRVCVSVTTAAG